MDRRSDLNGFVSVDTHRYSVPERMVGQALTVYKHLPSLAIRREAGLPEDRRYRLDTVHPDFAVRSQVGQIEEQLLDQSNHV